MRPSRSLQTATVVGLIKRFPTLVTLGIVFTILPIFLSVLFWIIMSGVDDVPKIDHEKVKANGKTAEGMITDIDIQYNISVNNQHPFIIAYTYETDNGAVESRFKTLEGHQLNVGDKIEVKYLGNESTIVALDPLSFPNILLYAIVAFLAVGLSCLLILFFRVRKQVNLYRFGRVVEAELVSVSQDAGLAYSMLRLGMMVHYQYQTSVGKKVLGASRSMDYLLMNGKKRGDIVKIFVSPEDESYSSLIPELEVVRNNWKI